MPIYEYECGLCKCIGEMLIRSNTDYNHEFICSRCGIGTMRRIMSKSNSQFKGTGFYETDYKEKK